MRTSSVVYVEVWFIHKCWTIHELKIKCMRSTVNVVTANKKKKKKKPFNTLKKLFYQYSLEQSSLSLHGLLMSVQFL